MMSSTSALLRLAVQRLMSCFIAILMVCFLHYDLSRFLLGHYTGRLAIRSTGALRDELDLLEGSLYLGRADIFTPYGARLITHPGTRLEYGSGVQMQGTMHLVPHPNYCGPIDCPVLKDTGPYANGLQWVVDAGSAE